MPTSSFFKPIVIKTETIKNIKLIKPIIIPQAETNRYEKGIALIKQFNPNTSRSIYKE